MEENRQPYISIVVTGRNDNYGGDFNSRLSTSLHWICENANKFKLETELVFVNYNPLEDQPSLPEVLDWPKRTEYFKTLFLTVPNSVHQQYVNPEIRKTLPLFEFIAKNLGIRQATGKYVLTINADILLSEEVFEEIAKKELSKERYYRANRCDFYPVDMGKGISANMNSIRKNVFKVFFAGGARKFTFKEDFEQEYLALMEKAKRRLKFKLLVSNFVRKTGDDFISREYYRVEWYAHCDASGDFILMHKDHWMALKGFPEDTYISTHTDSLMMMNIKTLGLQEVILPHPIFHQEHERRFVFGEGNKDMDLMYDKLQLLGKKILGTNTPIISNDDNWGLKEHKFETLIF